MSVVLLIWGGIGIGRSWWRKKNGNWYRPQNPDGSISFSYFFNLLLSKVWNMEPAVAYTRTHTDTTLNYDSVDRGQRDWPTWPVGLKITSHQWLKLASVLAALPTIHFTLNQHIAAPHSFYLHTSQASLSFPLCLSVSSPQLTRHIIYWQQHLIKKCSNK